MCVHRLLRSARRRYSHMMAHAGYSYTEAEGPERGQRRCSRELAAAVVRFREYGGEFLWSVDHEATAERGERRDAPLYQCGAVLPACPDGGCDDRWCGGAGGRGTSLGAVDLGPDGDGPHREVVEAQLALELMGRVRA